MQRAASRRGVDNSVWVQEPVDRKASAAGVMDALCGGRANLASDRAAAERMSDLSPLLVAGLRSGRGFVSRAVVSLGNEGIKQFIELGCGFPGARATHELAGRGRGGVRTVYADTDSSVVAHRDTMTWCGRGVVATHGDIHDPGSVLDDDRVRRMLNPSQPICLIFASALAHVGDSGAAAQAVSAWSDRLAPGSRLILCHPSAPEVRTELMAAQQAAEVFKCATGVPLVLRTRQQVSDLLTGWDVSSPGLVSVNAWRPAPLRGHPVPMLGAIATPTRDGGEGAR